MGSEDLTMFDTPDSDRAISKLASRDMPAGAPVLATLEAYWRELRAARALPSRTSICPSRIDEALPHAFVIERVAPGLARMRVCGQKLSDLIGMDGRGMPLSVLFSPAAQKTLGDRIERLFNDPAIIEMPVACKRGLTRPAMRGRLLMLPLSNGDGTVTKAIGALFVDGAGTKTARKFDIPTDTAHRIEPAVNDAPLLRVAAVGGQMHKGPALARPALRLVVDNAGA